MAARGKKLHHFVPRFYLKEWSKDEKLLCLQDGKIRSDSVRNVCAKNYFYSLHELTEQDEAFLREFIKQSPKAFHENHEILLRSLILPFKVRRRLELSGFDTPENLAPIETLIVEMNENIHTDIENDFQPYLKAMKQGDLSFLDEDKKPRISSGHWQSSIHARITFGKCALLWNPSDSPCTKELQTFSFT